jgi:ribosomal protein S18 acetylase RimI-like enzyme
MLLNKTIRLFLDSIGRREEYEFYLNKFQSADTACFALLVPDLESLEQGGDAFAFDLHFLISLGLHPAVVLCGSDTAAKWTLLAGNPLFEKAEFPNLGNSGGKVPVFFQGSEDVADAAPVCFQCLEKMIPAIGKRVHFIRAAGGFDTDYYYTQKQNSVVLDAEEKKLADAAAALLAARPGTHISVTSPINLLEEIFTVKGAGTVFRKGSKIISPDFRTLEKSRLLALLEESFRKKPKPGALNAVTTIYLDEAFRGAVLLEEQPEGLYLSKFAVGPEARGEGLAQELWDEVCKNHTSFFWRSRIGNSVNQWYDRQADGYYTSGQWMIFWRGVPPAALPGLIAFCTARPPDFDG